MKRYVFIFLLIIPSACFAQFFGLGGQYAGSKGQFTANLSMPYAVLGNDDNAFQFVLGSGLEYTTSGPKISGLYMKYVSVWLVSNNMESSASYGFRLDGGYNYNLTHGHNGVIASPNFYADFSAFYISAGYDYNMSHNEGQFFVRIGVGIYLGL